MLVLHLQRERSDGGVFAKSELGISEPAAAAPMSDKQAKLAAALRKRPSDDDVPPPLVPTRGPEEVKLRKSNLKGTTSWEQCLALLELNLKHEYAVCVETVTKMLTNITSNPSEPKFRKIRVSNPGFAAKVYSMKGAPELFTLVGFKDTVEEGFLVLPDGAVRLAAHTDPSFSATPCTHAEKSFRRISHWCSRTHALSPNLNRTSRRCSGPSTPSPRSRPAAARRRRSSASCVSGGSARHAS